MRIATEQSLDFEQIVNSLVDGITIVNRKGYFVFANKKAFSLLGLTITSLSKISAAQVLEKYSLYDQQGNVFDVKKLPGRKVLEGAKYAEAVIRFSETAAKKEFYSLVKAIPFVINGEKVAINIFQDITPAKESEKNKDTFVAMASHEIKSLLTSIKAYIQLSKKRAGQGDEKLVNYLSRVDVQVNKLTNMIIGLFDISRINSGKIKIIKETFSLDDLVAAIVTDTQVATDKKIVIKGASGAVIFADKIRIGEIIQNLLQNAIKYAPDSKKIVVTLLRTQANCEIRVTDFGVGIKKEELEKVFDLYYRSQEKSVAHTEGLGLGLFISQAIAKAHAGSITVESVYGKGSTFTLILPYSVPALS